MTIISNGGLVYFFIMLSKGHFSYVIMLFRIKVQLVRRFIKWMDEEERKLLQQYSTP